MGLQLPTTIFLVIDLEGTPVHSFATREAAEACCADFEREKREEANPFEYGTTLDTLTYLDADRLHDWVLDAGLEPPVADDEWRREDWFHWWDERRPVMTELQRAKVWQALAKLRFYGVLELEAAEGW